MAKLALHLWHDALVHDGTWARTALGDDLPPVTQFYVSDHADCREGRFTPRTNGFHGDVRVLVSPWCVSSCAGFVWELRDVLNDRTRLYSQSDSVDTTYSRLTVGVRPDPTAPSGVRVEILPRLNAPGESWTSDAPWVRMVVSITRTTDAAGRP